MCCPGGRRRRWRGWRRHGVGSGAHLPPRASFVKLPLPLLLLLPPHRERDAMLQLTLLTPPRGLSGLRGAPWGRLRGLVGAVLVHVTLVRLWLLVGPRLPLLRRRPPPVFLMLLLLLLGSLMMRKRVLRVLLLWLLMLMLLLLLLLLLV